MPNTAYQYHSIHMARFFSCVCVSNIRNLRMRWPRYFSVFYLFYWLYFPHVFILCRFLSVFFLQSQRIDFTSQSHSHAHFFHPWNFSSVDTKMWLCAQNLHFILGSVLFFHLICFSKSKLHGNSGNLLTNCLWLYNPKSLYLLFILCTS